MPIRQQQTERKSVRIGNNVWIGANVTILAGVEIPDGCIIGAGAVVTMKLDNINGIYVGNPARYIKSRFKY
jgi:maltose O-acetyltransferase